MDGVLIIRKEKGYTSHDVVAKLRGILHMKKIGHTGTLDPDAEGVLPVVLGRATKLVDLLTEKRKTYEALLHLGIETDTQDMTGEILSKKPVTVSEEEVTAAIHSFLGEQQQIPPMYSALKVNGKKLYELAREGKEVKIEPRRVNISKLEILEYDETNRRLTLHIECSKGTYIRSIAHDLGTELTTFGHLVKLVRVKAGMFEVNNAVSLEHIQTKEDVEKLLIAPLKKLNYMTYELNKNELVKVSNGTAIMPSKELPENSLILLTSQERLIAAAKMTKGLLKCLKVLG